MVGKDKRSYVDSSVYIAILLNESRAKKARAILRGDGLCTSSVLFLETERTLVRLAREKAISSAELIPLREQANADVNLFAVREPVLEIALSNEFPTISTPRSLDLLHLRTAIWFKRNGGLRLFVTLDSKQRSAAQEMGLAVWEG